ncbi:hypothetical protein MVEN_00849000 [Mycena venus]|uniref:mitochondrial processing peptidase n=1 Tax=Mycena venus TaxID=2733690 RepID=A0A8H6YFG8_9AGAR|nr:hypothetical protein MVEN_00849000 [Mycena venus]
MNEAVHIKWARARARKLRWQEEVDLLEEEMRHVLQFLQWRGRWWMEQVGQRDLEDGPQLEGETAYAIRQAGVQRRLHSLFVEAWEGMAALVEKGRLGLLPEDDEDGDSDSEGSEGGSSGEEDKPVTLLPQHQVKSTHSVPSYNWGIGMHGKQPLGRTIFRPKANILSIKRDDLDVYIKTNYTANWMVLVGACGVDHGELVKLVKKHFSSLVSLNPIRLGAAAHSKPSFVGSKVHLHDDELNTAHIAIAVEGVSWSSPDYFPMMVLQSVFGNWDRSLTSPPSSRTLSP